MENNPLVCRIWNEWIEKDKELSGMTREERLKCCRNYQWLFPKKKPGKMVELEALYSSVHQKSNREDFKKWFYVVCGYLLSRVHLGDNSYYQYKKISRNSSRGIPVQVMTSPNRFFWFWGYWGMLLNWTDLTVIQKGERTITVTTMLLIKRNLSLGAVLLCLELGYLNGR